MKLDQIDYAPLSDLDNAWSKVAQATFKLPLPVIIAATIGVTVAVTYLTQSIIGIWVGIVIFGWIAKKVAEFKEKVWERFATANGWQILAAPLASTTYVPPSLANIGRRRLLSPVIQVQFEGHECALFLYQFTTGSGKSSVTHFYTVAMVLLAKQFPHMILDSHATWALRERGDATQHIKLEGNFDKSFSLYCHPGEHIDALSVITPDVMQTLLDNNKPQDIEILGNYLYFMCAQDRRTAAALPPLFASVDALADQIAHKAKSIHYKVDAQAADARLSAALNTYLRSRKRIPEPLVVLIVVLALLPILLVMAFSFSGM